MTATAQTLTDLVVYPERGWLVDPETGIVYGVAGRWAGLPLGRVGTHGYLVSTYKGRAFLLHRVVWEACVGPIPVDMVINHKNGIKTDNRLVNLEVVTRRENNVHAVRMGLRNDRGTWGPANSNYRITPEMWVQIRDRLARGETCRTIASDYGVSASTISRIKRGVRWPT